MVDKDQLKEVLDIAMANGGDFSDIYIEEKKTTGISSEGKKIERISTGTVKGVGIRVISGENTAYAHSNDTSFESMKQLANVVAQASRGEKKEFALNFTKLVPSLEIVVEKRPEAVNIDEKVNLVKRAEQVAWNVDKRIKQVTIGYGDVVQKIIIANSLGEYVEDERIRTKFIVNGVASEGDVIQTGFEAKGGFAGFEYFNNNTPEDIATAATNRALIMLESKPAPTGKMPVVMAGEAGGTMVHEACGHGLEADLVQKGLSVYRGKVGEKVASELVTVVDDGTLQGEYGTFRFDDEGVKSGKNVLIENGILKDYMYDRLTAMKEGREPTGNGRRESYHDKPIPRMTNTYIASGKLDPEDIIRDTKKGLLVKKMGGGQVNTTNGDFVFDVAEGYLIENGKVTTPVRGATLTGNGPKALQQVDAVGSDLGYAIGTCGKDGQGVPVADAQPTMRIQELVVGGTG